MRTKKGSLLATIILAIIIGSVIAPEKRKIIQSKIKKDLHHGQLGWTTIAYIVTALKRKIFSTTPTIYKLPDTQ